MIVHTIDRLLRRNWVLFMQNISYLCYITHDVFQTFYQPFLGNPVQKTYTKKAVITKFQTHYLKNHTWCNTLHNRTTPPKAVTKKFTILVTKKHKKNQLSLVKETNKNKKKQFSNFYQCTTCCCSCSCSYSACITTIHHI